MLQGQPRCYPPIFLHVPSSSVHVHPLRHDIALMCSQVNSREEEKGCTALFAAASVASIAARWQRERCRELSTYSNKQSDYELCVLHLLEAGAGERAHGDN
jgi:hypothetical protein